MSVMVVGKSIPVRLLASYNVHCDNTRGVEVSGYRPLFPSHFQHSSPFVKNKMDSIHHSDASETEDSTAVSGCSGGGLFGDFWVVWVCRRLIKISPPGLDDLSAPGSR